MAARPRRRVLIRPWDTATPGASRSSARPPLPSSSRSSSPSRRPTLRQRLQPGSMKQDLLRRGRRSSSTSQPSARRQRLRLQPPCWLAA